MPTGRDQHFGFPLLDRRTALKGAAAATAAGFVPWPSGRATAQPAPLLDPAAVFSPALAYATQKARVIDIARSFAATDNRCELTQYVGKQAAEDSTTALIAHCHALTADPSFTRPGAEASATAVPKALLALTLEGGQVGTPTAFHPTTNYDAALRGLLVLANRYPAQIGAKGKLHITQSLLPPELVGGHPPGIEIVELANGNLGEGKSFWSKIEGVLAGLAAGAIAGGVVGGVVGGVAGAATSGAAVGAPVGAAADALSSKLLRVSETENHLLMIESSRFLINQMQHEFNPRDAKYDNVANGLRDWLLQRMAVIAQHDFLEFNARPYSRYALHALLNLHEFSREPLIATAAQHLLDYTMMKFALSSSRGRRVAPFRRQQYRINHQNNDRDDMLAGACDEVAGMFLAYAGFTDPAGHPRPDFPIGLQYSAVLAGTAAYRPTPAAYIVALEAETPASVHRFYHGARPQLPASPELAESGLEIYARSPSFLITAGGSFLNSGYGRDEFSLPSLLFAWEQTSRAQACTLIPTRLDARFHDLLRFEPYPDPQIDPIVNGANDVDDEKATMYHSSSVNTGVHAGVMAGANLRPGDKKIVLEHAVRSAQALAFHDGSTYVAWLDWSGRGVLTIARAQVTTVMGVEGVEGVDSVASFSIQPDAAQPDPAHAIERPPFPTPFAAPADSPPALASFGKQLVIAWTDPHFGFLHLALYDVEKRTLRAATKLADTSKCGPTLAAHDVQPHSADLGTTPAQLFLGWTGVGKGQLNVARLRVDPAPGAAHPLGIERKVTLLDTSEGAPSLASLRGLLFLAWQGTGDNMLNVMFSDDNGATFTGKQTYGERSSYGPCLTAHANYLHLAWKGSGNPRLNVMRLVLLGNTAGHTSLGDAVDKADLGESSDCAPAICSHDGVLVLSWQGLGERFLNLRVSRDATFQPWSGWRVVNRSESGFYFAIYRTPATPPADKDTPLDNLGFVYAVEAADMTRRGIDFANFEQQIRTRNAHLPARLVYGATYSFLPPDGRKFTIWFQLEGEKYRARVIESSQFLQDYSDLGLVSGPYMHSRNAHDGVLEIRHPGCEATPVVLDYHDWRQPSRDDAKATCPAPWMDRATALLATAVKLGQLGRPAEAGWAQADGLALQAEMAALVPAPHPSAPPALGPVPATIQKLAGMGVDYSNPKLPEWLGNPDYTPYPAIATALLKSGWNFRKPIYMDVIVGFYEQTAGVQSPRRVEDVRMDVLRAAVLAGSNERYTTRVRTLDDLLRP